MTFKFCLECGGPCLKKSIKEYKCEKCGKSFYDEPDAVSCAIISNKEGKYLWIIRGVEPGKGSMAFPGGFVDCGETLEDAAKREALEEAGVKITNLKYLGSFPASPIMNGETLNIVTAFFTAETEDEGKVEDENEVSGVLWLTKEQTDLGRVELADARAAVKKLFNI